MNCLEFRNWNLQHFVLWTYEFLFVFFFVVYYFGKYLLFHETSLIWINEVISGNHGTNTIDLNLCMMKKLHTIQLFFLFYVDFDSIFSPNSFLFKVELFIVQKFIENRSNFLRKFFSQIFSSAINCRWKIFQQGSI